MQFSSSHLFGKAEEFCSFLSETAADDIDDAAAD